MTTFTTQDRQDAQRTPLTDEQLWPLVEKFFGRDLELYYDFARAVEAAHGIGE